MIRFALVFLGLVLGVHEVELLVEGEVAEVRLELDGRKVASLEEPPWKVMCDFGASLHPHQLEAVALDGDGREIDRVRQLVNLPSERAAAAILLEGGDEGRSETARLVWQHIEYPRAERIAFRFDGRELPLTGPDRVELPPYEAARLHTLEAEIAFPDGARYRAELDLGGPTARGVDAELTGVTVVSSRGTPPGLRELEGRFRRDEEPLRVVGVEKAPARIVMVLDQTAIPALRELASFGTGLTTPQTDLRQGEQLLFLFPEVRRVEAKGVAARLFSLSQAFLAEDGSIPWVLTRVTPPATEPSPYRRISDAIAVAAVEAASGNRPRAVVVVLGTSAEDTSAYGIDEVSRFIGELRVPLFLWWTGQPLGETVSEDRRPLAVSTPWGKATDVSSPTRLMQATETLRLELESQLTVWIEGSHLPQQIELARGARGIRLAG